MVVRAPVFAPLVALLLVLTGCIGGASDKPAPVNKGNTNVTNATPTILPNGQQCGGCIETPKTVNNSTLDGQMHMHDYWHGKETVVVYDSDVSVSLTPVFERGDTSKAFEAFINLEKLPGDDKLPALIYEGTGKVSFAVTKAPQWATSYQMTFRTAGKDWSPWTTVDAGKPFAYEPAKTETDMPHSLRSLWNWKLQATGPLPVTGDALGAGASAGAVFHVQIIVQKSRSVDSWPPHPAFYDGVKERMVAFNKPGKTNVQNAADVEVYGVEPDQVTPDKLISMGTGTLDVFVNISQLTMPPGVPNGGFTLYWRTANTTPNSLGIFSLANSTDKTTKAYWHVVVTPDMVDSPYQPTSRFGFKVLANAVDDSKAACYRCVPYTIEYTMSIIARPDANMTSTMLM